MTNGKKTYDVFISHSVGNAALASEVANACRASGLEAFTETELHAGTDIGDALWDALAESRAFLLILPPTGPTTAMAIEIGAARAWNKPMFAVVTDPSTTRVSPALADTHLYTSGRIEEAIDAITLSVRQLSDEDRVLLANLYGEVGVSVDQLILEPQELAEFAKRFKTAAKKSTTEERLLSELLRMRKQGKLPRSRRIHRTRPRTGSA